MLLVTIPLLGDPKARLLLAGLVFTVVLLFSLFLALWGVFPMERDRKPEDGERQGGGGGWDDGASNSALMAAMASSQVHLDPPPLTSTQKHPLTRNV